MYKSPVRRHHLIGVWGFALLLASAGQARADDWVGPDKALHFGISLGISAGSYGAASLFVDSRLGRLAIGGAVGVGAGAGKELYDLWSDGDPSWRDFTWDLLGVATGLGLAWLIDELVGSRDPTRAARGHVLRATHQRHSTVADAWSMAGWRRQNWPVRPSWSR
jgi:putative lipoprotein